MLNVKFGGILSTDFGREDFDDVYHMTDNDRQQTNVDHKAHLCKVSSNSFWKFNCEPIPLSGWKVKRKPCISVCVKCRLYWYSPCCHGSLIDNLQLPCIFFLHDMISFFLELYECLFINQCPVFANLSIIVCPREMERGYTLFTFYFDFTCIIMTIWFFILPSGNHWYSRSQTVLVSPEILFLKLTMWVH